MYTINDAVLALILRFVGRDQGVTVSDREFIQRQLKAIREHIEKFPPEEQESRAIEWIEEHSREYRKAWEKEVVTKEFSEQRCPDCPLSENGSSRHCQIHDQWRELLRQYATDKISSSKYVKSALTLLAQHKEHLKIKQVR